MDTLIAVLALALSGYSVWKSLQFQEQQRELLEIRKKVNNLVLAREQAEAQASSHAEISARLITIGSKNHRLRIFNKGKATARNVRIDFPDGNQLIMESDIDQKLPMEFMQPGQTVELIAALVMNSPRKLRVQLRWQDEDGEEQNSIVDTTL